MLTIRKENFREDEINVILDGLVPKNHLVRKIENAKDFSFIYDKVKDLYSPLGAPSIDPVVLIKIVLIQYLFGIPSMRQTIREIEVNVAYRWFLGYSLTEKIPHFSTFNKNYERRFKNTDLFVVVCGGVTFGLDKGIYSLIAVIVNGLLVDLVIAKIDKVKSNNKIEDKKQLKNEQAS